MKIKFIGVGGAFAPISIGNSNMLLSQNGKNIAFSISIHNFTCAKYEIVSLIEPVLNALAGY